MMKEGAETGVGGSLPTSTEAFFVFPDKMTVFYHPSKSPPIYISDSTQIDPGRQALSRDRPVHSEVLKAWKSICYCVCLRAWMCVYRACNQHAGCKPTLTQWRSSNLQPVTDNGQKNLLPLKISACVLSLIVFMWFNFLYEVNDSTSSLIQAKSSILQASLAAVERTQWLWLL